MDEQPNQDIKTSKIIKSNLGKYTVTGGPGRPKNCLNKVTRMKNDLFIAWKKGGGKQRFLELMQGSDADFKWCVERLIMILPKEKVLGDGNDMPRITFQFIKNENIETIEVQSNNEQEGGNE